MYYVCKYTPVEILAGFHLETRRLDPCVDSFEIADSYSHPNLCGFGKGILEQIWREDVQELILINCCDVMRRIYDVVQQNRPMKFLYLLDLPHKNGKAEQVLLEKQLSKLIAALEDYTGQKFDLSQAVHACEETENAWQKEVIARENRMHISLQGAHSGEELLTNLEKTFRLPVVNDTCSGSRKMKFFFTDKKACGDACLTQGEPQNLIPGQEDFLAGYAGSLLGQTPCLRMHHVDSRKVTYAGYRGIVYHTMKFCDYYHFEYLRLKERKAVPILKIETDGTAGSAGQLSTRLEAFQERLAVNMGENMRSDREKREESSRQNSGKGYFAGIDSGSTSTDVVILDSTGKMVSYAICPTGFGAAAGAEKALKEALDKAGLKEEDLNACISTGYGRDTIGKGDAAVTEITCHARGAHYLNPATRTIIDIGGQDSKVICIDGDGNVQNFVMNDKCAAGTGRFLEMMARTLGLSMEEMASRGLTWKEDVTISSMCTVFAESEVVSLIARNTEVCDIIHGLNQAVASKTAALAKRVHGSGPYMMTGGVARNTGVVQMLEKKVGEKINVSDHAQLCGAIGAALIGMGQ